MPEDEDKLTALENAVYGDRRSDDAKKRDGHSGRIADLETDMNELRPLTPYLKLFGTAVRYLGFPTVIAIIYAVWRFFTQGGAP